MYVQVDGCGQPEPYDPAAGVHRGPAVACKPGLGLGAARGVVVLLHGGKYALARP